MKEYTREFFRLSCYAEDIMRDQYFAITTYVTGLGTIFTGMPMAGLTLEAVMELAKEIEQRLIRQGIILGYYQTRGARVGGSQSAQYTVFQMGTSSQLRGPFQQCQRPPYRVQ